MVFNILVFLLRLFDISIRYDLLVDNIMYVKVNIILIYIYLM